MIRTKTPQADLKRSYRRMLWISVAASLLLHAVLLSVLPSFDFTSLLTRSPLPTTIQLEPVPQTPATPVLPPPLPTMDRIAAKVVAPRLRAVVAPQVVTEFPLEEEIEAAELWMVEKQPKVLYRAVPAYPDSARAALVEGRVTARVLVGTTGKVERIDRIEGPVAFHEVVGNAARQWRFTPAVQNDEMVRVWVSLPFVFELE
ncbi:MAG: protein TonB [Candidatus Latescibacterota bacterium]|jgi:protein TonB